ncbi:MAG: hypothetical protein R3350_09340 [Saprospiraceae bacterium]|nr:hypothetical protein [Saprospiraceae bacterium]
MLIQDDKKLKDIQQKFRQKFPNLKLEFYSGRHESGEGSPITEKLDSEQTIGSVRTIHKEGDLKVSPSMAVAEFEKKMLDTYGLNVQVFRKSGNLWMQTTSTDHWTLEQQNRKGGSSELHFKEKNTS